MKFSYMCVRSNMVIYLIHKNDYPNEIALIKFGAKPLNIILFFIEAKKKLCILPHINEDLSQIVFIYYDYFNPETEIEGQSM